MRQPAPESGPDRRWGGHAAIPWELLIAPNECASAAGPRGSVLPLSLSSLQTVSDMAKDAPWAFQIPIRPTVMRRG